MPAHITMCAGMPCTEPCHVPSFALVRDPLWCGLVFVEGEGTCIGVYINTIFYSTIPSDNFVLSKQTKGGDYFAFA